MAFTINDFSNDSTKSRNSRYVQGGLTDIYKRRLGWWEKRVMERRNDDFTVNVLTSEEARPGRISQRVYGKDIYAWLVLQYNNIVDPEVELKAGTVLKLPSQSRLTLDIITKPEGGKPIT